MPPFYQHPDRWPVYSSDMTDAEWEVTLAALPVAVQLPSDGRAVRRPAASAGRPPSE